MNILFAPRHDRDGTRCKPGNVNHLDILRRDTGLPPRPPRREAPAHWHFRN